MLRRCFLLALLAAPLSSSVAHRAAFAATNQLLEMPGDAPQAGGSPPAVVPAPMPGGLDGHRVPPMLQERPPNEHFLNAPTAPPEDNGGEPANDAVEPGEPDSVTSKLNWLGLHHSTTNGRNVGLGIPLVTTSWLNRPYYVGGELGSLWITRSIFDDVTPDTDAAGGIFFGWDRDYYWGAEVRLDWATPELINEKARNAHRTDSMFMWSYSILYYPWGDAMWRPYWRCGIGDTHVDFPLANGSRHDEWLLSFPFGIGVEYPLRHWLAARAEFTDYLTVDDDGHIPTLNNLTLEFGLEWRFGAHPRSYWPWNPSRHIW